MDERAVRERIEEVTEALHQNEEEHRHLLAVLQGFEGLARLHGWSIELARPPSELTEVAHAPLTLPRQNLRLREAILLAIEQGGGRPMHAGEILQRVRELGADSKAEKPEAAVDAFAGQLSRDGAPIERAGPVTWRWVGNASNDTGGWRASPLPPSNTPKGQISVRRAIVAALREAGGRPMHAREIGSRIRELGAVTEARDPDHIIDLSASTMCKRDGSPLEKVAPKTWRWAGPLDGDGPPSVAPHENSGDSSQEELPLS